MAHSQSQPQHINHASPASAQTASPVNTAVVTAVMAPYLLINLLQSSNSNAASFQAAITNRLLTLATNQEINNNNAAVSNSSLSPKSAPSSTSIKRKTHLSNCFLNDLSQTEMASIKTEPSTSTSSSASYSYSSSLSCSPSLSSPASSPCSDNSFNDSTKTGGNQHQLFTYYQQQQLSQPVVSAHHQYEPQQSFSVKATGTTARKINFGDIADLIN